MKFSLRTLSAYKKRLSTCFTGKMNVHYLHIRKTGGTALKHVLAGHLVTPSAVIHMHPHRVLLEDVPDGHKVFFAVRDPVDRFHSGFVSRFNKSRPATYVAWTEGEAAAFAEFQAPNDLAEALSKNHPSYQKACAAMKSISHLNCSQWDWIGDQSVFEKRKDDILWIATQETLTDDFEQLKILLDLPPSLQLPQRESAVNASINSSANKLLSESAVGNVRDWYRADYKLIRTCDHWRSERIHSLSN